LCANLIRSIEFVLCAMRYEYLGIEEVWEQQMQVFVAGAKEFAMKSLLSHGFLPQMT